MNLPLLAHTRATALKEAVRWGEPCTFFIFPNVISWVVPLVRDQDVLGGLLGGAVLLDDGGCYRREAVNYLNAAGCLREQAEKLVQAIPCWKHRERPQKAAEFLFALISCEIDWNMELLRENRNKALRQRQIAEEIHRRKQGGRNQPLLDEERTLLSLIKAGDQKGVRSELNRTLGALFYHTADVRVIKAHVIEMMGYLLRSAIEDSPHMTSLIEENHAWMTAVIDADDFEAVFNVVADALEDFMRKVYLRGRSRTNTKVASILSYLNDNYHEHVTLDMLSEKYGLSTFRIAHLVKEVTGKSVLNHIHYLRIQEAQRLLEESDLSCADIAYETGYGDQSYFIKQFQRRLGTTPGRYRKLYRGGKTA